MSNPYIGEIRMFGASFAPAGWAFCNGALMPISENDALFTLIGTTYGGDGQETFGLPDLQGRVPMHAGTQAGNTYQHGEKGGVESVTLIRQQIPNHTHAFFATNTHGDIAESGGKHPAQGAGQIYTSANSPVDWPPVDHARRRQSAT